MSTNIRSVRTSLRSVVMYGRRMMHKLDTATVADVVCMFEQDCT